MILRVLRRGFRMSIRWQAGAVLLLSMAVFAAAQQSANAPSASQSAAPSGGQRGVQPMNEEATTPVKNGHQYVVAIGIDRYDNWPVLSTAGSDATGFAKLLTSKFGFEYAVEPLTEKNATRKAIISLIDDDLRNRLQPEDSLIIFFAGHGTTRNDKIGDVTRSVGFIVPVDAHRDADNRWSDYLNVEELLRTISTLPAGHILVILDSCHSGMALGSKFSTARDDTRFQQDMLRKVSRKVISSAQGDQQAADQGPLPDHSLFTGLMIQGLTTGQADAYGKGLVTSSQLGAYAQHEVGIAEGSKQTPLFGSFDLDEGGELIIHLGAGPSTAAEGANPATTLTKYETNEVARMRQEGSDKANPYWSDDDSLKNFPAARSAALKLCDGGDGWGCAEAAISFASGLGGGTDYPRAINLAQQACNAHAADACVILAALYSTGETIEPDLQGAARLFRETCSQGNLHGCYGLGNLYLQGRGVTQDNEQSKSLFTKACDGGEFKGCNGLGVLYAYGVGVPRDYGQALTWWQKTCDGGVMKGCENVGDLYLNGLGVAKDPAKTASLFQKACNGGEMEACSRLGAMYQNGLGVAKDGAQAVKLNQTACEGGEKRG